jgi:Concanavalin A-like lectin/glucanases superfamily
MSFSTAPVPRPFSTALSALVATAALVTLGCLSSGRTQAAEGARANQATLRPALTLHASFDVGPDADFAVGDRTLYYAPNMRPPREGTPGLPANSHVELAPEQGRFGHALRFVRKSPAMIFYQGQGNIDYRTSDWSGTVSLWLRVDPERDLDPGYTDPIQITTKDWNDAAFFVEFTQDEKPRHFRLGAYADLAVWNPDRRDWNTIPFREKPLVAVHQPGFRRDRWTHVVFTFERFNTGNPDGVAVLYLDGRRMGQISPRQQTFTWEDGKIRIMLGLSFIGFMDDLALFDRALSPDEVAVLHRLPKGVASIR